MDPVTVGAAITAAVAIIKAVMEMAAKSGFDEAACEAMKAKALEDMQAIDSSVIAAEAREWRCARGDLP